MLCNQVSRISSLLLIKKQHWSCEVSWFFPCYLCQWKKVGSLIYCIVQNLESLLHHHSSNIITWIIKKLKINNISSFFLPTVLPYHSKILLKLSQIVQNLLRAFSSVSVSENLTSFNQQVTQERVPCSLTTLYRLPNYFRQPGQLQSLRISLQIPQNRCQVSRSLFKDPFIQRVESMTLSIQKKQTKTNPKQNNRKKSSTHRS